MLSWKLLLNLLRVHSRRDSMHDYYYVSLRKTDLVKLKQSDIGLSDSLITCTEGFNLFHLGLTKKLC